MPTASYRADIFILRQYPPSAVIWSPLIGRVSDQHVFVGDMSPTKRSATQSLLAEGPGDLVAEYGVLGLESSDLPACGFESLAR